MFLLQVSRLILLSGASPNGRSEFFSNAPILCVAAREGFMEMVSLLLEFHARVDQAGEDGMSALCHAAAKGNVEIIRTLCAKRAKVKNCHSACVISSIFIYLYLSAIYSVI